MLTSKCAYYDYYDQHIVLHQLEMEIVHNYTPM